MTITLDELAGPEAADNFRMTVDWGRWYIDPLPECDIAPATEDRWPSCSTVKKASEKDWSFLVLPRMAAIDGDELHRIGGLDRTMRADAFKSHENHAKQIAFGRGSIVHLWKEDLLAGRQPRAITDGWLAANKYPTTARDEANVYLPAILDFFNTYQPEPVAVEYVTIHRTLNGHGYGATPDALLRIDGEVVAVDWKTRGEGSNHAAYAEEAAQIACGARAEYMIVRDGDRAARRPVPVVAGGYVISIKPDGARLYPIDIDKAWTHWCRLHEWWTHRLDEKASIGRVLPKRAPTEPNWRFKAKRRYDLLNDAQRAEYTARKATIDTGSPDAVFALLDEVEPFNETSTPAPKAASPSPVRPFSPDEGVTVAPATIAALRTAFEALPDAAQLWISTLTAQGKAAGVDWRTGVMPSLRRYELGRGVIRLAALNLDDDTLADVIRGLLQHVTGLDEPGQETTPLGAAIGLLNADETVGFAQAVDEYVAGLT